MVLSILALCVAGLLVWLLPRPPWSTEELARLDSLSLASLPPLPPDPSNRVADDPRAAEFGRTIFHSLRFSANGQVACDLCHWPDRYYTDRLPQAQGIGTVPLNTMTVLGAAYSPWYTWNGKSDSQWAQSLLALENPLEHGGDRTFYAHVVANRYAAPYTEIFGPLPDLADMQRFPPHAGPVAEPASRAAWEGMAAADQTAINQVFANLGKALAAYQRTLQPQPARFDGYVAAALADDRPEMAAIFTSEEEAGLRLFLGKAGCIGCHHGPLFTDFAFHNTGIAEGPMARGRATGVMLWAADPFNCLGVYSDAESEGCVQPQLEGALPGAFKTPTLRNVTETAPYMHTGAFPDLMAVLRHYNAGASGLAPLHLSQQELEQLAAFLGALTGPLP
jgi:cytochrome c peroxidase